MAKNDQKGNCRNCKLVARLHWCIGYEPVDLAPRVFCDLRGIADIPLCL